MTLRVLLVEPAAIQRELARALLEGGGMEVCSAASGPEALELAGSLHPHMILTELILPGFSGLELIHRYRARQGSAPIWVITVASGQWASQAALDAGADFLFYKPVCWPEVIRHLWQQAGSDPLDHLENTLLRLGLPRRWAGFGQTLRCARFLATGKCVMLKEAYIQIAREDHCSPHAVAKNVERSVQLLRASPLLSPDPPGGGSCKDFLLSLARGAIIPL